MLGAFLVAALAGHLGADEAVRGRLCIMEPGRTAVVERCSEVEGTDFDVAPAPAERVWVWSRRNLRTVALGTLDPGTTRIRLPDEPLPTTLEITGSADRDWPQPTTIAIGRFDRPALWKIELSPMHAERLREILLPRGSWSLSVRADRHVIASFPPFRLIDEPVELGRVELEPLPHILGTVIDGEGELLPSVLLIATYGGTWLPRGLRETIERLQGQKFHSGPAPRLVLEGLAPGTYGFIGVHAFSESEIPRHLYSLKPTAIHLGPVEQSGAVRVGGLETFCRGNICERRLK